MRRKPLAPQQLLALHIVGLITAGTILLLLPISAAAPGRPLSFVNAPSPPSAVCVTG
jgi:hypothetical protein